MFLNVLSTIFLSFNSKIFHSFNSKILVFGKLFYANSIDLIAYSKSQHNILWLEQTGGTNIGIKLWSLIFQSWWSMQSSTKICIWESAILCPKTWQKKKGFYTMLFMGWIIYSCTNKTNASILIMPMWKSYIVVLVT